MPIKFDTTLMRLVKDVNEIKSALRKVTTNLPLYDIANENTPASLSTDQNDYVPGNYDILRLSSSANVEITGIRNGKKGRRLQIFNVGSYQITLTHSDLSSQAENRFDIVGDENIVLFPTASVTLYYDYTQERWLVPERPAWLGKYGITFHGYCNPSIGTSGVSGDVKITGWTTIADEWGMFSTVNSRITIPFSGVYTGVLSGNFDANTSGFRRFGMYYSGAFVVAQNKNAIATAGKLTELSMPFSYPFAQGDTVEFYATQNSGSTLGLNNTRLTFSRVL